MTERQAWLYLAKRWEKIDDKDVCAHGLCYSIMRLREHGKIPLKTEDTMGKKIPAPSEKQAFYPYRWPLNKSGAQSRAKFCRKQAELLRGMK